MTSPRQAVTRFDHITIAARDIRAAVASYTALLGGAPIWRGSHPEFGTESALFGLENALVEITAPHPSAEEAEGMRQWIETAGEGLQAIAFGTDAADECSKLLRERGLRATPPQDGLARGNDGSIRTYRTVELSPRATRGIPVLIVERDDFVSLTRRDAEASSAHALDHVVIQTGDVAATKQLYETALGIRLALERDLNGTRMLFFRVGGVTLEVVENTSQGATDVFYGAAYRVRDLAGARDRLISGGVSVSELRPGHKAGTQVFTARDGTHGVATLFLHDPSRG